MCPRRKYLIEFVASNVTDTQIMKTLLSAFQQPHIVQYAITTSDATCSKLLYLEFNAKTLPDDVKQTFTKHYAIQTMRSASLPMLANMVQSASCYIGETEQPSIAPLQMQLTQHVARSAFTYYCHICKTMHATPCFSCDKAVRITCRDDSMDQPILDGIARLMLSHLYFACSRKLAKWEQNWLTDIKDWALTKGYDVHASPNVLINQLATTFAVPKLQSRSPPASISPYKRAELHIESSKLTHNTAAKLYRSTCKVCVGCGQSVCSACFDKHRCTLQHTHVGNQFVTRHDMVDLPNNASIDINKTFAHMQFPNGTFMIPDLITHLSRNDAYKWSSARLKTDGHYSTVRYNDMTSGTIKRAVVMCGVVKLLVHFDSFSTPKIHACLQNEIKALYTPTQCTLERL